MFLDEQHGICDVRDRAGIEYLLARPVNYEVAFEKYNVFFDERGNQIEIVKTELLTAEIPALLPIKSSIVSTMIKRRGRPRKLRV